MYVNISRNSEKRTPNPYLDEKSLKMQFLRKCNETEFTVNSVKKFAVS